MTSPQSTVMIVDDEKDILSVMTKFLERERFKVHAFDNPILALEHVRSGCSDCWLLVSDIRMPQMSGFELVKTVRQLRPELVIVLMTACEIDKDEFDKVLPSITIDELVVKPARISEVVETIRRYESIRQIA
jgi:DNA-binding NtrC family response regulator